MGKTPNISDLEQALTDSAFRGALATMLLASGAGPIQGEVSVKREGQQIIVPPGMALREAIVWLQRQMEAEEKIVAINHTITCFPLDGLVAVWAAFKEVFGFTDLGSTSGPWGPEPPQLMRVDISATEFVQVPYCELKPPAWEGGLIEPFVAGYNKLVFRGKIAKRHEASVKGLLEKAEQIVREKSIYKGKAVSMDLSWVEDLQQQNIRFDPMKHRPQFMDLSKVDEQMLILNDETKAALEGSVFLRIKRPEVCQQYGIPIKHGVLASGGYGTGKSTTGLVTGAIAERNGYTFIYCKTPDKLVEALDMARMLAPAVLFCEDVDPIFEGGRDEDMNAILEALDGIEAKGRDVITIFTTNFDHKINPAFMRPGRIDTMLRFDLPNPSVAAKFVDKYTTAPDGQSYLTADADKAEIGRVTAGNVPVVIGEIVQAAKCACLLREGGNIVGKLTTKDIVDAANYKARHIAMTKDKPQMTKGVALKAAHEIIAEVEIGGFDVNEVYYGELAGRGA